MQAADFNGQVLNFIRSGEPGRFEGLSDVVPELFSGPSPGEEEGEVVEVPVFSGAIIFTPSFRKNTVPPPGSQLTDPIYSRPGQPDQDRLGQPDPRLHAREYEPENQRRDISACRVRGRDGIQSMAWSPHIRIRAPTRLERQQCVRSPSRHPHPHPRCHPVHHRMELARSLRKPQRGRAIEVEEQAAGRVSRQSPPDPLGPGRWHGRARKFF